MRGEGKKKKKIEGNYSSDALDLRLLLSVARYGVHFLKISGVFKCMYIHANI